MATNIYQCHNEKIIVSKMYYPLSQIYPWFTIYLLTNLDIAPRDVTIL